jgi:hypothetical protein
MTERPKKQATDIAHLATRTVLGALSAGVGSELFSLVIAPPLEKRRDEWLDQLAERLSDLEMRVDGFSIQKLSNNEDFISVVMHATASALKNHNETKLEMLRNAVLNAAIGFKVDDSVHLILLRLIDELTPWHLKILCFLDDPLEYGNRNGITYPSWSVGGTSTVLEHAFPELRGQSALYDQLAKDLDVTGLISGSGFHTTMSAHGMFASRTTDLGKTFISFVSRP